MAAGDEIALADLYGHLEATLLAPADVKDFTPALRRMRLFLVGATQENITGGHTPDGTPWPPIQGLRARTGKGGSPKPLRDRGTLLASLSARGGEGTVNDLTATSLEWGTALDYAATQQDGATILPKTGKALAVPLTPEAYRVGSARDFPRPLRVVWPRGEARGRLVETRGRGKNRRDVTQYLLLPKAVIPARPFVGLTDELVGRLEAELADFLEERIGGNGE